jgi:predicted metal-dependent phosphoesterase TrpH
MMVAIVLSLTLYAATLEQRVMNVNDDAEENIVTGGMYLDNTDLEMIYDPDGNMNQLVGMRFTNITIPRGATITTAYVQFTADEVSTGTVALTVSGEAVDNAQTFSGNPYNIAARIRTIAQTPWSPAEWNTVGEAGLNQRTAEIKSIIQEIIDRPAWSSGNSIVIIISGQNGHRRCAKSYDGSTMDAPLIHIEYTTVTPTPTPTRPVTITPTRTITISPTRYVTISPTPSRRVTITTTRIVTITPTPTRRNTPTPTPTRPVYNVYYGHLHNHSYISDGTGSPSQAYAYARDVGKLDFFSLADHSDQIDATEWTNLKNTANTYNQDGSFVTFWGFEWSGPSQGHVAVINTADYCSAYSEATNMFPELLSWLSSRDCIAFFNHPSRQDSGDEFSHFATTPSDKLVGMELWNKGDIYNIYYYNDGYYRNDGNKGYYDEAITRNWNIGAAGSGDNHSATWGTDKEYRVAVWATAKTRAAIYEAFKARRFYSTLDKNLVLSLLINGQPMGSTINAGSYSAVIRASDGDNEVFTRVQLIKNGAVLYTWYPNQTNPNITQALTGAVGDYFYVRVQQADGYEAISAPIRVK